MAQTDAKAKTILDKMASKFQKYQGIDIEFSLTMDNAQENISETSRGKAWVKGNLYKIDLMGVETYFNGKTLWSYIKDAEEVNVSEPDGNDKNAFNPSKLFNSYQEGYKVRYLREVFESNRALHIIDLFPKDVKGSEFSRIRIKVDKDENAIYKIIRFGKDGNDYTVTVFKAKENKTLQDNMFTFDAKKYPDVEMIDLRE